MKFSLPSITLFLAASVAAQSTGNIPVCALMCFAQSIAQSGCSTTDLNCQCTKGQKTIQTGVTACLLKDKPCSASDMAKIQPAANELCAQASSGSSSATSSAKSGSSSTGKASATSTTASSSGSGSSTASAAQTSSTGAGGKVVVGGFGAMAEIAVAVGMFAL